MTDVGMEIRTRLKRVAGMACLVACVFLCLTVTATACPGCKDALAANDSHQYQIARGYFYSIIFMLTMPALIAGTFGTYVFIEVRRAKRDNEQLAESTTAELESASDRDE